MQKTDNKIPTRRIREIYLDQLVNQGYVDTLTSELDHRTDIYFPVVEAQEKEKQTESRQIQRYDANSFLCPMSYFPTPNYIKSKILALLENNDENTICEIKNNFDIDSIIERY